MRIFRRLRSVQLVPFIFPDISMLLYSWPMNLFPQSFLVWTSNRSTIVQVIASPMLLECRHINLLPWPLLAFTTTNRSIFVDPCLNCGRIFEFQKGVPIGYFTGVTNYLFDEWLVTPSNPHNLYNLYSKLVLFIAISWGKAWVIWSFWVK